MKQDKLKHGGVRQNAGRKPNEAERKKHLLSFTDDDWAYITTHAPSKRKIADFIAEAVRAYKKW